jgi:hypothetical protein
MHAAQRHRSGMPWRGVIATRRREVADSVPGRAESRPDAPPIYPRPVNGMPQPSDRHPGFIAEPMRCWAMVYMPRLLVVGVFSGNTITVSLTSQLIDGQPQRNPGDRQSE